MFARQISYQRSYEVAIFIKRGLNSPTNDCIRQTTLPIELRKGTDCEREKSGNSAPVIPDGYGDGYEDGYNTTNPADSRCAPGTEFRGYHRFSLTEFLSGTSVTGECVTPYSKHALGNGLQGALVAREEQLLRATGKPVQLLRRQYTGSRCLCYSLNRGRSKKRCPTCFGTTFTPGYIPYIWDKDPLGRIYVRFEPYEEQVAQKEQGMFQEVDINAWTLPFPQIRQRDVLIVYNKDDGTEEFRYEVMAVTRNETFQGSSGAQKFRIKRIDPTDPVYRYDPFAIPDLPDIQIDVSSAGTLLGDRFYDRMGDENDGLHQDIYVEAPFGDGAFSGMFAEGYKLGYEINFKRALEFKPALYAPDFDEDGFVDDGYGPIFKSSLGQVICFSTPQMLQDNDGIDPVEVVEAERKRHFLEGFLTGAKHGLQDGLNELRARGLLT